MSQPPPLPSGFVTFMFTDIVGSTDLKRKMSGATSGERQEAFREQVKQPHDAIITERVRARGGHVVKGTGDGFLLAFADAEKGVLCGVEIQQRMGKATIPTPDGILQIRIGLNSGQAEPVANDYTATAVDKAARVEGKAPPGSVFLSRETHELVRGKVRGLMTDSAGFHDLKGITGDDAGGFSGEELFVAFAEGSIAPFAGRNTSSGFDLNHPAAKPAQTSIPNNLPRLQPFFGRTEELKTIREALDPESRTWGALIDGPRGMGKTSLAVRAAYDCAQGQFSRIIFVSIKDNEMDDDGVRTLGNHLVAGLLEILNELARELDKPDITKAPEDQRIRLLLDTLRNTQTLLILDNLESLTKPDRDQIFTFVKRLPQGCKAILTSSRRIGSSADTLILEKLDQRAALATLADLAKKNKLLARTNEAERISLYVQTGGKPLLLRWVAGQLGRGSCRSLKDALDYLHSCPKDNDPLEFIFGALAQEFTPEETKVLCALTYFAQPAEVGHIHVLADPARQNQPEASGEGGNELTLDEVESALRTLANRSLVVPDQEEKAYSLVPMVADFLRRKRPEVVEQTGSRLEHRAYALIVENGYRNHDRFPVLEAAWPGIAPALPLFLAGDNARLQTVCFALRAFLHFQARWDEGLALCEKAEARAVASADYDNAGWRAYETGWIFSLRQQADAVLACAERAAAHWRRGGAGARERATATRLIGIGHRLKKNYPAAITAYSQALEVHLGLETESMDVAIVLNALGECERFAGNFGVAEGHYREALRVARAVGFAEGVAGMTSNLAELALGREDWPAAEALAREAHPLVEEVGRQELIAELARRLAHALVRQGKADEALAHARRSVEIYTQLGSPELSPAQAVLAQCEAAQG